MSKADRLKKLKIEQMQQDLEFRKKEEYRKRSKEEAKATKKFLKSESKLFLLFKLLMFIPFLYSGFFYGGVSIIAILRNMIAVPKSVGFIMLGSVLVMAVAIILAFMRKYLLTFIFSAVSTVAFFFCTNKYFVQYATGRVTESGELNPEHTYMIRFYPIVLFAVFALVLFLLSVGFRVKKARREKQRRDNAPVKSIIDE